MDDKRNMKNITLDKQTQSELLGRLYAEENILETSHLSTVKKEMTDPSYDYQCDQENAWVFYNHVTHALKKSHPTSWLSDLQKFQNFIHLMYYQVWELTPQIVLAVYLKKQQMQQQILKHKIFLQWVIIKYDEC